MNTRGYRRFIATAITLPMAVCLLFGAGGHGPSSTGYAAETPPVSATLARDPQPVAGDSTPSPSTTADGAPAATPHPAYRLVIHVPARRLLVFRAEGAPDEIVREFPVGVGRMQFPTPEGQFRVLRKIRNPGWENPYKQAGAVRVPAGNGNPLGTRWIGFHKDSHGEYGIHGTDRPQSVGQFSSHGCVRMKIPDAEAVFELVEVGTPVSVSYEPFLIRRRGDRLELTVYPDPWGRRRFEPQAALATLRERYPGLTVEASAINALAKAQAGSPVALGAAPLAQPTEAAEDPHFDTLPPPMLPEIAFTAVATLPVVPEPPAPPSAWRQALTQSLRHTRTATRDWARP